MDYPYSIYNSSNEEPVYPCAMYEVEGNDVSTRYPDCLYLSTMESHSLEVNTCTENQLNDTCQCVSSCACKQLFNNKKEAIDSTSDEKKKESNDFEQVSETSDGSSDIIQAGSIIADETWLFAGWVTVHKQGLLNRTIKRWMAIRGTHLLLFTKPLAEQLGCYNLYLAKVTFVPPNTPTSKILISGAFIPNGILEVTTSSETDAETWARTIGEVVKRHSEREVKTSLNKTPSNCSFNSRQKIREEWLTRHLHAFYSGEEEQGRPMADIDIPKVVQAFVFHELRLYMRMIGRYSNRAQDLDFLLDPPDDTQPSSFGAFYKDDVAEVMWRYHWLEGHLASFFQKYDPEQRRDASRVAAVHLGREDMLRVTLLIRYPNSELDTAFLLDAPMMEPNGWRDSAELFLTTSCVDGDENGGSSTGTSSGVGTPFSTTILPSAFERWASGVATTEPDPECCCVKKSVRFNLDTAADPPNRNRSNSTFAKLRDGSFTNSIKQLLRMGT